MSAEHTSDAPHEGQAAALYRELGLAKALAESYRVKIVSLEDQWTALVAERDRLRKSAAAWDALMAVVGRAREQDEDEPHPAIEPLLDKILELRDVKAERDRLRDAARAFLVLLDRTQFSAVALRGKELDALRRECGD